MWASPPTAVVNGMDLTEEAAKASIAGFLAGEITVIMGGAEREAHIKSNFLKLRKIDTAAKYETLRARTVRHRSA